MVYKFLRLGYMRLGYMYMKKIQESTQPSPG